MKWKNEQQTGLQTTPAKNDNKEDVTMGFRMNEIQVLRVADAPLRGQIMGMNLRLYDLHYIWFKLTQVFN